MADLCRELEDIGSQNLNAFVNIAGRRENKASARFFADDLAVYCQDKSQLSAAWRKIESWSRNNKIQINKRKSAVLELRVDNRTPMPVNWDFYDIPLVKEYKYLEVVIIDTLKFKIHYEEQGRKEK